MKIRFKRKVESNPVPRISEAEWRVMRVVCAQAPVTAKQVVGALSGETDWKPKTIHTLLRRLVDKGAIRFERRGREYLFHPVVEESVYAHEASRSFLSQFFDGGLAPFLARFLEREKLSRAEIEQLRKILDSNQK